MLVHIEGNKYRKKTAKGNRYYALVTCKVCGKTYYTDWYNPVYYCSRACKGTSRGRPIGTQLTDITRNYISESMQGLSKSADTREKISRAVIKNYRKHPELKEHKYDIPNNELYIYHKWHGIKKRCYDRRNKNYKYYGAKGITVCEEWRDFMNFYSWLKEHKYEKGLHIHRIDPDGPYCPDNCVILTPAEHKIKKNAKKVKKIINGNFSHF